MTKEILAVQEIGNEVCEGCGPNRDCGLEYDDCRRIQNAIAILNEYCKEEL